MHAEAIECAYHRAKRETLRNAQRGEIVACIVVRRLHVYDVRLWVVCTIKYNVRPGIPTQNNYLQLKCVHTFAPHTRFNDSPHCSHRIIDFDFRKRIGDQMNARKSFSGHPMSIILLLLIDDNRTDSNMGHSAFTVACVSSCCHNN